MLLIAGMLFICFGLSAEISHHEIKDLENPFVTDGITIYIDWDYKVWIVKWVDTHHTWYTLEVEYNGTDWRFLDGKVRILTKDGLTRLEDRDPRRRVREGGVTETVTVQIELGLIESIMKSEEVKIQFYIEPVSIPPEGLSDLRDFYEEHISSDSSAADPTTSP